MVSCELCGKTAVTKARIEGVVFSVCAGCASLGQEYKAPASAAQKAKTPLGLRETLVGGELVTDYGVRLRKARQKRQLAEKDAAKLLNIKESMLLHLEQAKMQPDDALVHKLERFYGISLRESS